MPSAQVLHQHHAEHRDQHGLHRGLTTGPTRPGALEPGAIAVRDRAPPKPVGASAIWIGHGGQEFAAFRTVYGLNPPGGFGARAG